MNNQDGILEQVLRVARRRKWVILQATIAVPILAFLLTATQPKEYTASATLLFRQPPAALETEASISDPTREAATNGELVALPVISEETAKALGEGFTGAEIYESIEVAPSSEAETATVSATTESPDRSARIATAYAESYIEFRRSADRAQVQDAIDLAEASLESLGEAEREGGEGAALRSQLDRLKLSQALQTGGAELVQPATPPGAPSSPHPSRNVALGVVVGLLLGFGIALVLERIDRRVRSVEELERLYGLPVLARIPRSQKLNRVSSWLGSRSQEGESFRVLRTNLRFFDVDQEKKSILVVSPEEADGKSTVARGLAMTMAEMGDDVVFVEADLRKGSQLLGVNGKPALGLANALAGGPLDRLLIDIDVPAGGLSGPRSMGLLPAGPIPPNPSELLESGRMAQVVGELHERFDWVILDSPALGVVSDALALVPLASEMIVVGGIGKTTRDAARALGQQFKLLGKQPVGVVVNFTEVDRGKHSHYYGADPADSTAAVS